MKKKYKDYEYMGTKEAAERWGVTQKKVWSWCYKEVIEGVEQDERGSPYRILIRASPPNYKGG